MDTSELKYWLAISQMTKIGARRFQKLYQYFPDMKTVWSEASKTDLQDAGFSEKIAEEFIIRKQNISPEAELEKLEQKNIRVITIKDQAFVINEVRYWYSTLTKE